MGFIVKWMSSYSYINGQEKFDSYEEARRFKEKNSDSWVSFSIRFQVEE